jgi:hypothetical protein
MILMSLKDFLGKTPEITIIDFLIENMDMSYDSDDISEYTGLFGQEFLETMETLIYNEIIEQNLKTRKFTVKRNIINEMLVGAVYGHSFTMAEKK